MDSGQPHELSSDYYLDDIYAFFLNCYHLKDWIKNDATLATNVQLSVEPHINSSRPLKLCGDICNSLKHLRLIRKNRSGESPAFGKKKFALSLGTGPTTISLKYEVMTTTVAIDAFQLATECVESWNNFLADNGLGLTP